MSAFDFSNEIELGARYRLDWTKLDGKTVLITGATGLVGKYMIRILLKRNELFNAGIRILAVGRDPEKFRRRFADVTGLEAVRFLKQDVQIPFTLDEQPDYVVHMASNTHPRLYASDPIGTEMSNILGTYHLLNMISDLPGCRFVFVSSGDVYGDNRSGKPFIEETDCGYIDCNTLRAGYIEGKRASEALCNAYREAKGVDFVTARLCRIYGPTMQTTDSKAISQFIMKAVAAEDIVLKSSGQQTFSYLYIFDAVTALLAIMASGVSGNAYNVADNNQALSLKDLAGLLAGIGGKSVVFDLPDRLESKGASTFQNVCLDAAKLYSLGWKSEVPCEDGLRWTVSQIRQSQYNRE